MMTVIPFFDNEDAAVKAVDDVINNRSPEALIKGINNQTFKFTHWPHELNGKKFVATVSALGNAYRGEVHVWSSPNGTDAQGVFNLMQLALCGYGSAYNKFSS